MRLEQKILKNYFGYDSLREGQEQLIDGILEGRDVLGIMPTGAGKSLCYQASALSMEGITIVVSPLISLMTDQVKALNQAGVHAAYINSLLSERQIELALAYAAKGRYKIIYVAPERLLTPRFLQFAQNAPIAMLTVDEAHCISQWGQDFRPSYLEIVKFLNRLPNRPIISAFTATATQQVKKDIIEILQLADPKIVITGFDRPNLFFRVVTRKGGLETDNSILHYVRQHSEESGIIYCATRKNVDKVYELLLGHGVNAGRYHAGLTQDERKQQQEDFTYDRTQVMVATNAFGMGIDKSNVRYVLHYNMPQSIEYYYQEAGRAGRDGEEAECVLFYSKQDIMINKRLIESKHLQGNETVTDSAVLRASDLRKLNQMIHYCETEECLRQYMLEYFGETGNCNCEKCSNCVVVEEVEEEQILFTRSGHKKTAALVADLTETGQELFGILREKRSEIAQEQSVPPYLICSDKSLKDMCAKLPKNADALLDVYGMGEQKVRHYGEAFLEVICNFLAHTEEDPRMVRAKKRSRKKEDFYMDPALLDQIELCEETQVSTLVGLINEKNPNTECKKLTATTVNQWLLCEGYLMEEQVGENVHKRVTEKGSALGMREEYRDQRGRQYYAIYHKEPAQKMIIGLVREKLIKKDTEEEAEAFIS